VYRGGLSAASNELLKQTAVHALSVILTEPTFNVQVNIIGRPVSHSGDAFPSHNLLAGSEETKSKPGETLTENI